MNPILRSLICSAIRTSAKKGNTVRVGTDEETGVTPLIRHAFMRPDECWWEGKFWYKLPWYCPFNIFLHTWGANVKMAYFHDHPRWSITVVLRGRLQEITPKYNRELGVGDIVFRSHKAVHKLYTSSDERPITLFIVGRRKYTQYLYNDVGDKIKLLVG